MARGQNQRTSLAGEYYVASELLRRDWNVALTYGNTERNDMLAEKSGEIRRVIALQVKAKLTRGSWRMSAPADPSSQNADEWFAFVDFAVESGTLPVIYIVPRDHVAMLGKAQKSLSVKNGGKFINASDISHYVDAWSLLDKPAAKATVGFDDWVYENVQ